MKKILCSLIIMITLLILEFMILFNSKTVLDSVIFSFNIWKNNIFPSLFPLFVLSNILINYGFVELLGEICKPLMKVFKINPKCSFIFIMSIISGFPSNAKYTKELYMNNIIGNDDASKILLFTHFSNPLFILGTISIAFLNNKKIGLLILICHYLSNIVIGIILRNYKPYNGNYNMSFKNGIMNMHNKRINNSNSFGTIITDSIINTINTLLLILGTVTIFLVLTSLLNRILNINSLSQSILNGLFEITQGLKYVSIESISLKLKALLSTMIISFGGLSVHMQVISILSDTDIRYLPFLLTRILHSIISGILVLIFYNVFIS